MVRFYQQQKIFLKDYFIFFEIGACEGTLSCSTCHLILRKEDYDHLKPPNDEENDMLDLAFGLQPTSRLGCQINVESKMEGWVFVVPKEVADARK